jgi:hypothetical protein
MSPHHSSIKALARVLRLPSLAAAAALAGASSFGQTALVSSSPFAPAGGAAGTKAAAPAEDYELSGSSVQGSQVTICVFERQKKHSEWIAVGGDSGGIHVVSYDPAQDTAVVTISGARKQLSMHKSAVVSSNPAAGGRAPGGQVAPAAAPVAPIASAGPEAPANLTAAGRDQREARMLVSDLLEIGVQQRKAFQDARQKAAAANPTPQN